MAQSGVGGQHQAHAPEAVAPLGHGQSSELVGHGVTVRYTQSHLKVTWDNGTEVVLRSVGRRTTAHVDHIRLGVDIVTLTLKAQIAVPDPWFSHVDVVLAFPGSLAADVRRLAEMLNTTQEDSGPDAGNPKSAPRMPPPPIQDAPKPAQPNPANPAELPHVMFQADLAAWADDDDWIGLYPSLETTRLITGRPLRQSREASSPPSA